MRIDRVPRKYHHASRIYVYKKSCCELNEGRVQSIVLFLLRLFPKYCWIGRSSCAGKICIWFVWTMKWKGEEKYEPKWWHHIFNSKTPTGTNKQSLPPTVWTLSNGVFAMNVKCCKLTAQRAHPFKLFVFGCRHSTECSVSLIFSQSRRSPLDSYRKICICFEKKSVSMINSF